MRQSSYTGVSGGVEGYEPEAEVRARRMTRLIKSEAINVSNILRYGLLRASRPM